MYIGYHLARKEMTEIVRSANGTDRLFPAGAVCIPVASEKRPVVAIESSLASRTGVSSRSVLEDISLWGPRRVAKSEQRAAGLSEWA
jgi:hypothetical protein